MRGQNVSTEEIEGNLTEAKGRARKVKSQMTASEGDSQDRRVQMMAKLRTLLVKTPADDNGMVPGTPFTQAGVARMMTMLGKRSGEGGSGKLAAGMEKFLSPDSPDEETISGASVKKLQALAKRTEAMKDQVKKRQKG